MGGGGGEGAAQIHREDRIKITQRYDSKAAKKMWTLEGLCVRAGGRGGGANTYSGLQLWHGCDGAIQDHFSDGFLSGEERRGLTKELFHDDAQLT